MIMGGAAFLLHPLCSASSFSAARAVLSSGCSWGHGEEDQHTADSDSIPLELLGKACAVRTLLSTCYLGVQLKEGSKLPLASSTLQAIAAALGSLVLPRSFPKSLFQWK